MCKMQIKFLNNQVHVDTATLDASSSLQMEEKPPLSDWQQGRSWPPGRGTFKGTSNIDHLQYT